MPMLRCKEGFIIAAETRGDRVVVVKGGAIISDDNPIARAHPDKFEPVRDEVQERIEMASARPGERRDAVVAAAPEKKKWRKPKSDAVVEAPVVEGDVE